MPRKTTAYACEHGCKRSVLTSKKKMVSHEKRCFHNPEMRACATCANFESFEDSNGMEHEPQNLHWWRHTECLADDEIDLSEKLKHDCDLYECKAT